MVLRCPNAGEVVRNAYEGHADYPALEYVVCSEHDQQMRDGVPYRYDALSNAVYMGKDINAAGQRMLTEYVGWSDWAGLPPDTRLHKFRDDAGEELHVLIPGALLGKLRAEWESWGFGDTEYEAEKERQQSPDE